MLILIHLLTSNTFWYTDKNDGSECHKLIMVFSDGGTENPTKILNVYTNSSREITSDARIFTYAVGIHVFIYYYTFMLLLVKRLIIINIFYLSAGPHPLPTVA